MPNVESKEKNDKENYDKDITNKKCNKIIRNIRIEIAKKVIPITLVITTTISGEIYGSYKLSREKKYKTTSITYIEGVNEPTKKQTYEDKLSDENKITLTVTSPYINSYKDYYQRTIKEYDVTDFDFDNIEDYFNIDISKRIANEYQEGEYLNNIKSGDFHENDLKELMIINQDFNDYKYFKNNTKFAFLLCIAALLNIIPVTFYYLLFGEDKFKEIYSLVIKLLDNKHFKKMLNDQDFWLDESTDVKDDHAKKRYFNENYYKYMVTHYGFVPELETFYYIVNNHYSNYLIKEISEAKKKIKKLKNSSE